jgi:rhodanese-related sulfurtransferase
MKSEEKAKTDFVVVDVRDDDFIGGNIKGAINQPSSEFLMNVDRLVMQTKQVRCVIFHCALSQVRWVFQTIIFKPNE